MRRIPYALIAVAFVLVCGVVNADSKGYDSPSSVSDVETPQPTPQPPAVPTLMDVREWTVSQMLRWSRPGRSLHPPAQETFEEGRMRYGAIADAARDVAYDPNEKPIFGGRYGRAKSMALILAISLFESGYRKDVDLNIGKLARGDGGKSWCLMQLQLGTPIFVHSDGKRAIDPNGPGVKESTPTRIVLDGGGIHFTHDQTLGYGGPDLIADRRLCLRAGYRAVRRSFKACRKLPISERLSAYASGNCEGGREASRKRVGTAVRWVNSVRPPLQDQNVMSLLKQGTLPSTPTPAPTDRLDLASASSP